MGRIKSEHGERGDVGGDFTVPPAGEYNTVVIRFDEDGDYQGIRIINPVLAIADGEYEQKLIKPAFFVRIGSKREEEKMETFLHFLNGLDIQLEAALPDGTSWLDEVSINWIKLNAINKAVRVDTYVKKGKPNAEGKVYENSEVIAFMTADMNFPSGTKMGGADTNSPNVGTTQPAGSGGTALV